MSNLVKWTQFVFLKTKNQYLIQANPTVGENTEKYQIWVISKWELGKLKKGTLKNSCTRGM